MSEEREPSRDSGVAVRPSSIHGLGVFAARAFLPGDIVLSLEDSRIVDSEHPLRPELGEREEHCDYLAGVTVVLMRSPERHINSSCEPNTYVKTIDGIRRVIALRRIEGGDEITHDYLVNCHGGAVWTCRCGADTCRRVIPSSFFDLPAEEQRRLLPLLDSWFVDEHRNLIYELLSG